MNNKMTKQPKEKKRSFNWEEIHRRMSAVQKGIEHGMDLSPEEKKKQLKERSGRYARSVRMDTAIHEVAEVVVFTLAYETYAIESSYVTEVYYLSDIVFVPDAPSFVVGIVNVRGRIISVVELKRFFDLPQKGITELNKVIILQNKEMEFGILADEVLGMKTIRSDTLQKPLPTMSGIREQYLKGLTNDPICVLDGAKLLSDPKMKID